MLNINYMLKRFVLTVDKLTEPEKKYAYKKSIRITETNMNGIRGSADVTCP